MGYHSVVDEIKRLLEERGIQYALFEHEPVKTSEEAAAVRVSYTLAQGAKALIVRVKKEGQKSFVMLVVSGDKKFDVKKVRRLLGAGDIRFASEAEVRELTGGVEPGGVPPLGGVFALPTIADTGVFDNDELIFNAGDRRVSIAVAAEGYRSLASPRVADIADG